MAASLSNGDHQMEDECLTFAALSDSRVVDDLQCGLWFLIRQTVNKFNYIGEFS